MNIELFKDLTTEEALQKLEAQGEDYKGLYVDMDKKEQRKFVKECAANINKLLKAVDRKRIDLPADYKREVNKQAESIKTRLEAANAPFSALIDKHNEKRRKILAEEKRIADEASAFIQMGNDHEIAILLNDKFDLDKIEALRQAEADRLANEKRIADEATAQLKLDSEREIREAKQREEKLIADKIAAEERAEREKLAAVEREKQRQIDEKNKIESVRLAREADKNHKASVNNSALEAISYHSGIPTIEAKEVVIAIASGLIPNITINY